MAKIESEVREVNKPAEKLFAFLSNFDNFKSLMPPQIVNWKSDGDSCSFTIQGMANIGMRIAEKKAPTEIKIVSDGKVPFDFTLDVFLTPVAEDKTEVQLKMKADVNPFMAVMVTGPLKNFLNILTEKMEEIPI